MKKTLTCLIIVISIFFMQNNVFAAYLENAGYVIDSIEEVKNEFSGKANIEENKITLTSDIEFLHPNLSEEYDVVNISGEYILDLNGYKIKAGDLYLVEGDLTINDSKGTGTIESFSLTTEEGASLTINNGSYPTVYSAGTLIINNGNFKGLFPFGKTIVKDGVFDFFNYRYASADVSISGGTFRDTEANEAAIVIYGKDESKKDISTLNDLADVGYEFVYENYTENKWDDTYEEYYTGTVKVIKASDNYSETFKKITKDIYLEVNAIKPTSYEDANFLLEAIVNSKIEGIDGCYIAVDVDGNVEKFNPEIATLTLDCDKRESHTIKIKYLDQTIEKVKLINSVIEEMKYWENVRDITTKNSYVLDDLYLINYLYSNAGAKIISNNALNFAKDLIDAINGANISFEFAPGAGGGGELYKEAIGRVNIYYEGDAFTTRNIGLVVNNVIYIPENTKNTDEAYIKAAIKRIKDYMGENTLISITKGETLESLNYYDISAGRIITWNDHGLMDEETCGENYYNVKINGNIYKFVISKKPLNELEIPKYIGSNIENNIIITSDNPNIPLDTSITAKSISNKKIEETLGTNNYIAYDISLYSKNREQKITKLENGKFIVSIPVPEELEGKKIKVFYINDKGEKEEHPALVKDNYVVFETDHFSTYALVENTSLVSNIEVPKTADGIFTYLILTLISVFGIVFITKNLKKKNN